MKKTNKNTSKKAFKPAYVVDLTGVQSKEEATLRFALCKYENKIDNFSASDIQALSDYIAALSTVIAVGELINDDHIWIIGCGSVYVTPSVDGTIVKTEVKLKPMKKPNIFKRFWNWITRKK